MHETGENDENERLERRREIIEKIDELDEIIQEMEPGRERNIAQNLIDVAKNALFEISTDQERVERIEEFLPLHEEMYEISDGEYQVTLDSVLTPWGAVPPKWGELSPSLQNKLLSIKSENPWIVDSEYEEENGKE